MPPLNPPHVKIGIAFLSNAFLYFKIEIGMATVMNLARQDNNNDDKIVDLHK